MSDLHAHLTKRLEAGYRQLRRSLEGLTKADALRDSDPAWRRYRFGIGLDGSIRGIVAHLAVWKHSAAAGLASAFPPVSDEQVPPEWDALLAWLETGQSALLGAWARVQPEGVNRTAIWEGHQMSLADVVTHLIEHDHYHAGQINLLRQRMGHDLPDR